MGILKDRAPKVSVRKAGGRIAASALDHTRARQLWRQAAARAVAADPEADATPAMLRIGPKRLLLPRLDPRGSILGHDLLTEGVNGLVARPISGQDLALSMIGPRDAPRCMVTTGTATAATLSAEYPELLVIAAGPSLTAWTGRHLQTVIGQRPLHVICPKEEGDFTAQVMTLLPHAILPASREHAVPELADNAVGITTVPPPVPPGDDAVQPSESGMDHLEHWSSTWLST